MSGYIVKSRAREEWIFFGAELWCHDDLCRLFAEERQSPEHINVHIWIIMCNAIAAYDVRWNRFAVISECARRCCSHSPHSFTDFCVLHTFDFSDTAASVEETRSNEQMRAMVIGEEGEKEVWQKTQMRARQEDFVIISISSTAYKK